MASCRMTISSPCNRISQSAFAALSPHSALQKKGGGLQQLGNRRTGRSAWSSLEKTRFKFIETPWGVRVWQCSWVTCLELSKSHRGLHVCKSNMSAATLASRFPSLEVNENSDEQKGDGGPSSVDAVQHDAPNQINAEVATFDLTRGIRNSSSSKRQFCKRCGKAALLCVCHHIKTVVNNKTVITILQHPQEKNHHLGSARIALLALQNVEMISIPEVDEQISYRMREKVPGSKRFIAGRGGRKAQSLQEGNKKKKKASANVLTGPKLQPSEFNSDSGHELRSQKSPNAAIGDVTPLEFDVTLGAEETAMTSSEDQQLVQCSAVPPWIKLQPDAGLLFPSEHAVDLWPAGLALTSSFDRVLTFQSEEANGGGKGVLSNSPSQLIVLDGTWSKAKRIFFENPWLHSLPHYRLPTLQESRYGRLRPEPKPGFLSTVESIVYALQLIEPETKDLESLLDVFDSMIEDQMRFVADKPCMLRMGIDAGM